MTSLAEIQNQPHVEVIDRVETDPIPHERFDLEDRVAALQKAVLGLLQKEANGPGLSEPKLKWLIYELGNLTLPKPGATEQVKWSRLEMSDWATWAEELKAVRLNTGRQRLAAQPGLPLSERSRQIQQLEEEEVDLNELFQRVSTAKGVTKVLHISLKKSGIEDEAERNRIINSIDPIHQGCIATEVASLRSRATATTISAIPQDPPTGTFGRSGVGPFDAAQS